MLEDILQEKDDLAEMLLRTSREYYPNVLIELLRDESLHMFQVNSSPKQFIKCSLLERIYDILLNNDVNKHMYKSNKTIYFDDSLDAHMVDGLNWVFEQLQCLEIINCVGTSTLASAHEQHIMLEEMFRTETQNRERMQAFMKNGKLNWPNEFSKPGFFWGHQYKQSNL